MHSPDIAGAVGMAAADAVKQSGRDKAHCRALSRRFCIALYRRIWVECFVPPSRFQYISTPLCDICPCPAQKIRVMMVEAVTVASNWLRPTVNRLSPLFADFAI
jgi:hypothetical protein